MSKVLGSLYSLFEALHSFWKLCIVFLGLCRVCRGFDDSDMELELSDVTQRLSKNYVFYRGIRGILYQQIFGPISISGFLLYLFYHFLLFALDSDRFCFPDRITEKSISTIC